MSRLAVIALLAWSVASVWQATAGEVRLSGLAGGHNGCFRCR